MTPSAQSPRSLVQLVAASPEQQPVLANLLELYIHDFSEFHPVNMGENGRFGYPNLDLYWQQPGRYPFLLRVDGAIAGLALVQEISPSRSEPLIRDIAEFFVLRGFRRQKIGASAAHAMWRQFPGPWQVRVMQSNLAAHAFWRSAATSFAGEAVQSSSIEKDGETWTVFRFTSNPDHGR